MKARRKIKKVTTLRPRDVRTRHEICRLRRDNFNGTTFWALLNGDGTYSITITQQRSGEAAAQSIRIPLHEFNKIVDWYMRPQKVSK